MDNKTILIIGSGQLGSRHLQALKNINTPLLINVVDPSETSLNVAKERYDSLPAGKQLHKVDYNKSIPESLKNIDIAIIATNSNVRRKVVQKLLLTSRVRYLILEKLLFQRKNDYFLVNKLLKEKGTRAWVNCSMRTMPFYAGLRGYFLNKSIQYIVNGSQYGMVTNLIHYLDHMLYVTGCSNFTVQTDCLDSRTIPSKRKGFLELNGTLFIRLENGSTGMITCYPDEDCPFIVEIYSDSYRCISCETEKKAWISSIDNKWLWKEISTDIPFQSTMTSGVVTDLLNHGKCKLAPFEESVKTHLSLLEPLLQFLNTKTGKKFDHYPFT